MSKLYTQWKFNRVLVDESVMNLFFIFSTIVILASCGPNHPLIDPTFTQEQKSLIISEFQNISALKLNSDHIKNKKTQNFYLQMFPGGGLQGVDHMISSRVHYIFPDQVRFQGMDIDPDTYVAMNVGAQLWYLKQTGEDVPSVDQQKLPLFSKPSGMILLGSSFWQKDQPELWIKHLSILIHEARHTDCSQLPSQKDLTAFKNGDELSQPFCGYPHILCPKGHDLEGSPACDGHYWGAYAVQALWLKGIRQSCVNCSKKQKNYLDALYLDTAYRVKDFDQLLKGRLSKMKSYNSDFFANLKVQDDMFQWQAKRKQILSQLNKLNADEVKTEQNVKNANPDLILHNVNLLKKDKVESAL